MINSEHGKFLFSLFYLFFFKTLRCDMKKRGTPLWNYKFYTLWTSFRRFFFPLLWSVWPVIYLIVLLQSAGVVGFAGKAPFSPARTKQNESHAQELAKSDFCRFSPTCSVSLPPDLQRNIVLCFSLFCNCFSSGVSFFATWWVVVQLWGSILEIQKQLLVSPLNECWLQTFNWLIYLMHFFCFCHCGKIWNNLRLSLSFSIFRIEK